MENTESTEGKKYLDPLPSSDSKYWEHADINKNIVPQPLHKLEEGHYFVRKSAVTAQCVHCDWGFELDPGDQIIEGHLYNRNGKLVL